MNRDETFMQRCIELAQNGLGYTAPNPMVGCVIVRAGLIVAEGFHREYGGAHAEVNAISSVKDDALLKECTLYVNLEPCSHHGKTPPCCDLIIEKGIPRVVIGITDPHNLVAGKGIKRMKDAGIEVVTDVLTKECLHLNRRFFTYHQKQRPYIILKWAQTQDGFMDRLRNAHEKGVNWITGATTKRLVHLWRAQEQAILVGKQTVLNDNPSLTVREVAGKNPVRVVMDKQLVLQSHHAVFNADAKTVVFNELKNEPVNEHLLYIQIPFDGNEITVMMKHLHAMEIQSIMVEGGAVTLNSFLDKNLWDEARILTGRAFFGSGLAAPKINASLSEQYEMGEDLVSVFFNT